MLQTIINASLRYRYLVVGIAIVVLLFGMQRMRDMSVDVLPEFAPPVVELQTEALGLSAQEVESLITLNLEEFLSGTSWLQTITSESTPGVSSVLLTFEPGTNLMRARQLVQERLTLAYTLPNISKAPVMLQPLSAANRALIVGLTSKAMSPIQVSVLAQWTIKPRLMGVPGVANVVLWGERRHQLQVLIDPEQLQAHNITQEQIIRTAGDALWVSPLTFLDASFPGAGGWIDTPNQRLGIRHALPISSPSDMAQMPVWGSTLKLGDVATVVEGHPPMIGDAFVNSEPGMLLVIEKFPWAKTTDVTRGVEKALAGLTAGLPGLNVDTHVFRSATYIEVATYNIGWTILVSGALIVLVLSIFLFNVRMVLMAAAAIILSLCAAVAVLYFYGTPINMIVIAGIGLALVAVVNDAIVEADQVFRRLQSGPDGKTRDGNARSIMRSCVDVRRPTVFATLIMALLLVPIFALGGSTGAFFRPLAIAFYIALFSSMVVALTVTPALAMLLLRRSDKATESGTKSAVQGRYEGLLSRVLGAPRALLFIAACCAIAVFVFVPISDKHLVPTFKERDLLIDLTAPPGTSHEEMSRIITLVSNELRSLPEVKGVGSQIGRAVTGDQIVGINSSQMWVSLQPAAPYESTIARIEEIIDQFHGLDAGVKTYMHKRSSGVAAEDSEDLTVRLYGIKREVLREKAREIEGLLAKVPGFTEVHVEDFPEEPHVQVEVDLQKALAAGLKPGDVRRAAATVFAGIEVGSLFEDQKVFEVVVWGARSSRDSLTRLKEMPVETPDGKYVKLEDVANVTLVSTPTVIRHEAVSPYIDIDVRVSGRTFESVYAEIRERMKTIEFPLEYHAEILGGYADRQAMSRQFWAVVIASVLCIGLMLQASLHSWRMAGVTFLLLPFSMVGAVIAVLLGGGVLSLGSALGCVAVYGLAARNSLVMAERFRSLQLDDGEKFGLNLVLRGARECSRSIILTALTLAIALIPWIVYGNAAGLEVEYPMALTIMGGLITSTVFSLLVLPALYLSFAKPAEPSDSAIN